MTTLTAMIAEIASDLSRSDLDAAIRRGISRAIRDYAWRDWFFSQDRDCSFNTVVSQIYYTEADHASLPFLEKVHWVKTYIGTEAYDLEKADSSRFAELIAEATLVGEPRYYCWYGDGSDRFGLYPASNQPYPMRIGGIFRPLPPTADGETGNVWMNQAYDLILSKAKYYVFRDKIRNFDMAQAQLPSIDEAESNLVSRGNRRSRRGRISRVRPDCP